MDERDETSMVDDLQKQLREKEMDLNDFRLDALNSAQQMDQYKESLAQMKVSTFFSPSVIIGFHGHLFSRVK